MSYSFYSLQLTKYVTIRNRLFATVEDNNILIEKTKAVVEFKLLKYLYEIYLHYFD